MAIQKAVDTRTLRANYQRETDSIHLYRELSRLARDPKVRDALAKMAEQEEENARLWEKQLRTLGADGRSPGPDLRTRILVLLGRWLGEGAALSLILDDEVRDIIEYAKQAQRTGYGTPYQRLMAVEMSHANALAALRRPRSGSQPEPWHRGAHATGWLREVVYGFNDGLTANFGLVMGVVGANVDSHGIILTGLAGLMANALSMTASGFLASRSQQEVREHQLLLEEAELRLVPKHETEEIAGFYEEKGLTRPEAKKMADRLMQNPDEALTQIAREELGIDPEVPADPLKDGILTGVSTGLGAMIPLIPFLLLNGTTAVGTALVVSMLTHFLVGASRAVFTGRSVFRSGLEMFAIGMAVALVTFLIGQMLHTQP